MYINKQSKLTFITSKGSQKWGSGW